MSQTTNTLDNSTADNSPVDKAAISPTKLAHFVLRSAHYRESVQWWNNFLGARAQFESEFLTFLTYDEEHHRLAIVNAPNAKTASRDSVGFDHVAFSYASLEQLVLNYERLKKSEIKPYWCINHGPTTSLYYRDPDQNQAELQVNNFPTDEESSAFFHSDTFRKNPIGVEFDVEVLVKKFHAGTPVEELLKQGSAPAP